MQQNRWFLLASLGLITTILFALAALTQWDAQAAPAQYETSLSNLALQADPTSTPLISPFPSPTLTVTIEAEPVAITFTNTSQPPQPTLFNTPGITLAINLTTTNDITAALTHGPLSGEVTDTSAVLWARGNQNGQILFTVWPVEPIDMGDDMDGMDDTTDDTSTDDTDTDVDNTDTLTDTTPITSTTPITTTDTTTATISTDTDTTDETTGSDEDASEEDTSEEDTSEETNTEEEADSEETTQPITTTETTTDTLDTTDTLTETETITTTTTITTTDTTTDTLGTSEPITDTGVMTMTVPMASYPLTMTVNISSATDFTGDVIVTGLHPNTDYYYQAVLVTDAGTSQPIQGIFATAPAHDEGAPLSFVFGSCLGGQGYCRDPETGWQIFNTMQAQNPDFFVITGDSIYVDSACAAPNVPGSEGPFSDLDGFHNRYRYHLGDTNYASFLAQTPVYVTWDDHEIIDDFGGPFLNKYNPALFAEGTQAFFDYWPLRAETGRIYRSVRYGAHAELIILDTRSYRDPNVNWDTNPQSLTPKTMLGAEQFAWLQETLATSDAHWKFIVTSTPLSYPTGFPQPEVDGRDGWANYTERSGYETELMSLLFFLEAQQIDNVIFLTGDTHWPFALSYDPDRDGEANFYEFGSSPLSAINLAPTATPDPTFNPTVLFAEGQFQGTVFNFGHVAVDAEGNLTFRLVDRDGTELYNMTLNP